jgi:protein-tyrosine kinase
VDRPTDPHALSPEDATKLAPFREGVVSDVRHSAGEATIGGVAPAPSVSRTASAAPAATTVEPAMLDRSIGDIIAELKALSVEEVERILEHQRTSGLRFGEAALALGLVSREEVLYALSRQFHYPYASEPTRAASPELVTLNEPFGVRAEHFRALRSQLMMRLFSPGAPRQGLAIISPDTMDGKTYCACNLAVVLAQLGGRTLLVDADMRGPRVHSVFNLEARTGLSGILAGRGDGQVFQQVAAVPSLFVLPVGVTPPNPLELVEGAAFGLLMRELVSKFEHVIVDTPAVVYGADANVIAARCGAALLVARKDKARVAALQELAAGFTGVPVRLAGVVVNEF